MVSVWEAGSSRVVSTWFSGKELPEVPGEAGAVCDVGIVGKAAEVRTGSED